MLLIRYGVAQRNDSAQPISTLPSVVRAFHDFIWQGVTACMPQVVTYYLGILREKSQCGTP